METDLAPPLRATIAWSYDNRTAGFRVVGHGRGLRVECRVPGADANPYLALAALVASAADGIRRGLAPPPPVEGDASGRADLPPLPTSLEAALRAFDDDAALRSALGETFSDYFRVSRAWELKAWQEAVSDWERDRYERVV